MIAKACFLVVAVAAGMLIGASLYAAEQSRLPRIGVLWASLVDPWVKAFHEGLRENGYVDGVSAVVDIRATGENFQLGPRLAEELIALDPDVIYAVPAAFVKDFADAEKKAGKQIPIVALTWDPVAEGLVVSAAHPGGTLLGWRATHPGTS